MTQIGEVSIPSMIIAFGAGLVSFLSPCVLPVVPSYITYISGITLEDLEGSGARVARLRATLHSIFFIIGFSIVFIVLGTSLGLILGIAGNKDLLTRIGGALIIILGLIIAGVIKSTALMKERKFHLSSKPIGYLGSVLVGITFAFGWSPCIGPILAAILALTTAEKSSLGGLVLLSVYSLGLAVPFLAAGVAIGAFYAFFNRFKRFIGVVTVLSGWLLVLLGVSMVSGYYTKFTERLAAGFTIPGLEDAQTPAPAGGTGVQLGGEKIELPVLGRAPDFSLPGTDGKRYSLANYRGKVVLVNFWATWCDPCKAETPDLIALGHDYAGKGLVLLSISIDKMKEKVGPTAKEWGIDYPVLLNDGKVHLQFGATQGVPITYLIDREGNIRAKYIGSQSRQTLEKALKLLL